MFDWDPGNLRKIRAHRISREEAEETLINDAIPILEQYVEDERRFVYYGETDARRLIGTHCDRARRQNSSGDRLRSRRRAKAGLFRASGARRLIQ